MIYRDITKKLIELAKQYSIITLTGPRQSGKSTLLKSVFSEYNYVSLEDPDIRTFCDEDPRAFLTTYPDKTIIDEAQRVPKLFSYLQTHVDLENKAGMYLLAGSHNFSLMQQIGQSLAGRTAILKLLPLSANELTQAEVRPKSVDEEIFIGGYPRIYDKSLSPNDFYSFYIESYVQRDVRMMKNIGDLSRFIKFLKLCAGRIGQLLNLSSLANDCGIAISTAQAWISLLEASYVVYLLKPNHNNYSKRLIKAPKLYFYDTGLAVSLLELRDHSQISNHYLRGGLFENLVINEFVKTSLNNAEEPPLTFWRDSTGNEVDLLRNSLEGNIAYEIKSGATYNSEFFKGLKKWMTISGYKAKQCNVVYSGNQTLKTSNGELIPWRELRI